MRQQRWTPMFAPSSATSSPRPPADVLHYLPSNTTQPPASAALQAELAEARRQLAENRQSLTEARERVWALEAAERRCQELAEKVATLKQERDEMQQQQAALLERVGESRHPTHTLSLPPPRSVTHGGEWALREALAETETERDELAHELARARERFNLVNSIVGRSEQQAKKATAEYSAVKEQLTNLKAEQKRVLRQQDELVDDLEELELERDELRVRLHHETTFGKANNAPPPVEAREPTKGKSRKAGKTHARGNGLAYPGDSSAGDDYYVDVSSEASSPPPTPPETPHESSLRVPRAGKDEGLLAVDWSAISGLVGVA